MVAAIFVRLALPAKLAVAERARPPPLHYVAMGEYVIKCRFQSNRTHRYIRLHNIMALSAFR
jgi:hypothetical protein